MKCDEQMENDIQALGLTAPRVTPASIEEFMKQLTFEFHQVPGTTATYCFAIYNGFVIAEAFTACVNPENFNEELGRKYAQIQAEEKARGKLWELEGWHMKRAG